MNKKGLIVLCLAAALICVLALNARTHSKTQQHASSMVAQTLPRLPEVAEGVSDPGPYMALFRHLNHLEKQSERFKHLGKDGSGFHGRFRNVLVIDEDQFERLKEIAITWESQMEVVDKKAAAIIENFRTVYPAGKIPEGVIVPPPPADLLALQEERKRMTLNAVSRFKDALGAREFVRFDEIMKSRMSRKVEHFESPNKSR